MRDAGGELGLRLARALVVPATLAAVVLAVAGPLTWFLLRYDEVRQEAASFARFLAAEVSEGSGDLPDLWIYNTPKIAARVDALHPRSPERMVRIIDGRGRLVHQAGPMARPGIWAIHSLPGTGVTGAVVVGLPAGPVLWRGLVLLACFALLGAACGSFLFLVPVRSLVRAEETKALAARVFAAQEEERQRIARDLHDSAGQLLTAIRINLEAATRSLAADGPTAPGLPSLLAETASLADGTIASIRDLVGSLDAPLFRPGGLEPAVRQLAFQLGRSGCTLSVDAAGLAGMRPSRATEVCAFRVVQEAVTNAVRHAAPCRIEVRLEGRPDGLAVSVCDDGPGAGAAREGHGLRGMRERVTLLGGTLTVRSTGGGFAVTALVPWLPEEPPRPEEDLHG